MAKITADFYKEMAAKIPPTKTIEVPVGDETYTIVLKNYITVKESEEIMTKLVDLVAEGIDLDVDPTGVSVFMIIYDVLTDIEFPEDLKGKYAQLNWLLDAGVLMQVSKALRPGLVEQAAELIALGVAELNSMTEEALNKEVPVTE